MLARRVAAASGVSGASWPKPQGLVWSNDGWPGSPRTIKRFHCPLRFGYLEKSTTCASALDSVSATAVVATNRLRHMARHLLGRLAYYCPAVCGGDGPR